MYHFMYFMFTKRKYIWNLQKGIIDDNIMRYTLVELKKSQRNIIQQKFFKDDLQTQCDDLTEIIL